MFIRVDIFWAYIIIHTVGPVLNYHHGTDVWKVVFPDFFFSFLFLAQTIFYATFPKTAELEELK